MKSIEVRKIKTHLKEELEGSFSVTRGNGKIFSRVEFENYSDANEYWEKFV